MPLGPGVQNPEHGLPDRPGRDWFAAGPIVRTMFFGEMVPNPLPVVIAQSQHAGTYRAEGQAVNYFEIDSRAQRRRFVARLSGERGKMKSCGFDGSAYLIARSQFSTGRFAKQTIVHGRGCCNECP